LTHLGLLEPKFSMKRKKEAHAASSQQTASYVELRLRNWRCTQSDLWLNSPSYFKVHHLVGKSQTCIPSCPANPYLVGGWSTQRLFLCFEKSLGRG
jgi:hypothetical protein